MKRGKALVVALLLAAGAPAWSQTVFKCTTPAGTVSYQETPCVAAGDQKRVNTSHGAAADPDARRMLEKEALKGDPLAHGFLDEVRERERLEREERLRLEREKPRPVAQEPEWMPPWGWAGPPGRALPKPAPTK